jgi:hypothetical protein
MPSFDNLFRFARRPREMLAALRGLAEPERRDFADQWDQHDQELEDYLEQQAVELEGHGHTTGVPVAVGTSLATGTSGTYADAEHVHTNGRGPISESALGIDRVDIGDGGTPRIIFEDAGFTIWQIDNDGGTLRFFNPGATRATLSTAGLLTVSNLNFSTTPAAPPAVAASSSAGVDLSPARSDHTHADATVAHGVVRSATTQVFPDNTETVINFDTTVENVGLTYDAANDEWEVLTAGVYVISASIELGLNPGVDTNFTVFELNLIKNRGTSPVYVAVDAKPPFTVTGGSVRQPAPGASTALRLAVGETITATFKQLNSQLTSFSSVVINRASPVMTITRIGP